MLNTFVTIKSPRTRWALDFFSLVLIWTLIGLVVGKNLNAGGFWWTDESRHAMGGVFILDLIRDMPFGDPMGYALRYFAQYPALALNWYPPFFYGVESLVYAVLGISEQSARLTVLLFLLLGMGAWYLWARAGWGRSVALLSALLVALNPQLVLWASSVMLEAPALAMIMLAVFTFEQYLVTPRMRTALLCGVTLALMLLLKQSTVFILPALLAYAALSGRGRLLVRREAFAAYALVALALALLTVHALKFGMVGLGATVGQLHETAGGATPRLSWARWLLYPETLLKTWGIPLTLLSVLGLFATFGARRKPHDALIWCWLFAWFLMATLLFGVKDSAARYTIYALPPLALLACRGLVELPARRLAHNLALGGITLLVAWSGWQAWRSPPPYVNGYQEAARLVMAQPHTGPILFAGRFDGNFIFHLLTMDTARQQVVLRGDKILVSMSVQKYFGMQSYAQNEDDILKILDKYGIGLVVVENPDLVGLKEFGLLNDTLSKPQFRLLKEYPIATTLAEASRVKIQIYQYLEQKPSKDGTIVIPLPHMGREIRLQQGQTLGNTR